MMEVSAGIIRRKDGAVLICQRGEGHHHAHQWEFPGGKREAGESAEACLIRELREELSLPVTDVVPRMAREAEGIRFTFLTAETAAEPVMTEHEAALFVRPRAMLGYAFCPADAPVARALALNDPPLRHFFWDFDGTLMDTYPMSVEVFVRAAATMGLTVDPAYALRLMKDTLPRCVRTIAEEHGVDTEELFAAFRREEALVDIATVPPLTGIPETLRALRNRGGHHYLVTHRDRKSLDFLRCAGLLDLFDDFVTLENGLARKPQPDMVQYLLTKHDLNPAECVMIGDRPLDTAAGRNAGILSCMLDPDGRFPDDPSELRVDTAVGLDAALCPEPPGFSCA